MSAASEPNNPTPASKTDELASLLAVSIPASGVLLISMMVRGITIEARSTKKAPNIF